MRQHYLTKMFNPILILISLFTFIVAAKELFFTKRIEYSSKLQTIGLVDSVKHLVKIKKYHLFDWKIISDGSILNVKDMIFTHKGSNVSLALNQSQNITLFEETMVQLEKTDEIIIGQGEVELKFNKESRPLKIFINNKQFQISSKNATIKIKNESKKIKFDISEGQIELKTSDAKIPKVIDKSFTIETKIIENKFVYEENELEVINDIFIISPKDKYKEISYYKKSTIYFNWEKHKKIKNYTLEIYDSNKNIVLSKVISGNHYNWQTNLEGSFSWEVRPADSEILLKQIKEYSFLIEHQNLSNQKSQVLEIKRPNQLIEFSWVKNIQAKSHKFEVSESVDFKEIIINIKTKQNNIKISFPKTGVYFWRSSSIGSNGQKVYNRPTKVIIKPSPPPKKPIPLPNLDLEVRLRKTKTKSIFSYIINNAHADSFGNVNLRWRPLDDAKYYEIEIFSDPQLQRKIKGIKVSKPSYNWEIPRLGKYYWRYRIIDFWGRKSPYSDSSIILIKENKSKRLSAKEKSISDNENKSHSKIAENHKKHSSTLFYSPTLNHYTQRSSDTYKIKGNALAAMQYIQDIKFNEDSNLQISYEQQSGKVFDDQDFVFRNLSVNYQKSFFGINTSLGLRSIQGPIYKTNSTPIVDYLDTAHLLNIGATYLWHSYKTKANLNFAYGEYLYYDTTLTYQFYSINNLVLLSGIGYKSLSFSKNQIDTKSNQIQILIGSEIRY